jgi:hypothetical protein
MTIQPVVHSCLNSLAVLASLHQCSASVTFWHGSGCGSSDPYLWLTDPDADPGLDSMRILLFSSVTFKTQKKYFYACSFLKVHSHHCSKITSQKELIKQHKSRLSKFVCLLMEGTGSGSVQINCGSGFRSRRPKNKRILVYGCGSGCGVEHWFTWG